MLAQLWQRGISLEGGWSQDWMCCTDRERPSPSKTGGAGAAPDFPAAPSSPEQPAENSFRRRMTAAKSFFHKEEEVKEVGTPLETSDEEEAPLAVPPLPSYYDQMKSVGKQEKDDGSEDSMSSDEEFERDLTEAGRGLSVALTTERKNLNERPDKDLEQRIDSTLKELEGLADLDMDGGGGRTQNRHRRVRRHMPKKSAAPTTAAEQTRTATDLGAGEGEEVKQAAKLSNMKEQIRQERRLWGEVPGEVRKSQRSHESGQLQSDRSVVEGEIKRYQETMRRRYEKMGAKAGKTEPFKSSDSIAEAVREGVLAYHQQCQKMGKWQVFTAEDADLGMHDLTPEEREKLLDHIKRLSADVDENSEEGCWQTPNKMMHASNTARFRSEIIRGGNSARSVMGRGQQSVSASMWESGGSGGDSRRTGRATAGSGGTSMRVARMKGTVVG